MLGNAQTYVGVLATLIVLCLYNKEENNFLLNTIIKVGDDLFNMLRNHVLILKEDINSIYNNKKDGITPKVPSLLKEANEENYKKMMRIIHAIRLQENLFAQEANVILQDIDRRKKDLKSKEELTYVALVSLIIVVFVLCLDCTTIIPINFRSEFSIILMVVGGIYCLILYKKYLDGTLETIQSGRYKHFTIAEKISIVSKMFLIFFFWLLSLFFINNDVLSIILLPFMLCLGVWLIKKEYVHYYNPYNHLFVFKHTTYIVTYSFICAALIEVLQCSSIIYDLSVTIGWSKYLDSWNSNIDKLTDLNLLKHTSIVYATLNGFVIPLWLGFYKWNKLKEDMEKTLNELQNSYKKRVNEYLIEFHHLEREIEIERF